MNHGKLVKEQKYKSGTEQDKKDYQNLCYKPLCKGCTDVADPNCPGKHLLIIYTTFIPDLTQYFN